MKQFPPMITIPRWVHEGEPCTIQDLMAAMGDRPAEAALLDHDLEARIRKGFAGQPFMKTIGAELDVIGPGEATIVLPFRPSLGQQFGHLHAGVTTALADTACGYAVYTLVGESTGVVSVEFKINLLAPAKGERFIACGKVIKAGRLLMICRGDVWAMSGGDGTLVAAMQATMMPVEM